MWWEAVPSLSIIVAFLTMPHIFTYATNSLFLGNAYKRQLATYDDAHNYLRDMRISGINDAYKQIGLDCFEPVEPEDEKPPEGAAKIC